MILKNRLPVIRKIASAKIFAAIEALGGSRGGLVSIQALGQRLGESQPFRLHADLAMLRRAGKLTMSGAEGRHGLGPDEGKWLMDDGGGHKLGYVSLKGLGKVRTKEGRWITIGSGRGNRTTGDKHGGTHVYLEDGKITRGPAALTGKPIDKLPERPAKVDYGDAYKPEPRKPEGKLPKKPKPKPEKPAKPTVPEAEAPEPYHGEPTHEPERRPGGDAVSQPDEGAGGEVAPETPGPGGEGAGEGRADTGEPAGEGAAQGVPPAGDKPTDDAEQEAATAKGSEVASAALTAAVKSEGVTTESFKRAAATQAEVNKRLDRYGDVFRRKGLHQAAEWLDKLREHVNRVGAEAALASLGEDKGSGASERTEYEGWWADEDGNVKMGDFARDYLDRNGIDLLQPDAQRTEKVVSSSSPSQGGHVPDPYMTGDFTPKDPNLKDKLEESKNLPGLESSEDIGVIMGKPVKNLTGDVVAKMDEKYGPGQWIIKAYGDEAAAGYGIFFPQRVAQITKQAQDTIWQAGSELDKYGFKIGRDPDTGKAIGIIHSSGDIYQFSTPEYEQTIQGDARHWGDRAAAAAANEQGAELPGGGKDFMAQPAFKAVGVSDADRAAGKTIAPGEGRVHIVTRNGKAELVPHSTWIKGEGLPVVFEDDDTRAMAKAAVDAVNALPESERQGQIYAPDILKAEGGYRVVEANPANKTGSSGYLGDNPFIIDSYVSHLTGRSPAHVRFIRKLLTKRAKGEKGILRGVRKQGASRGPKCMLPKV